jgi:superfamily I DNA/RNA helicase
MRDARQLIEKQEITLLYSAIIVDEAQDMSMQVFKPLRSMVPKNPNDLLVVGDGHHAQGKRPRI